MLILCAEKRLVIFDSFVDLVHSIFVLFLGLLDQVFHFPQVFSKAAVVELKSIDYFFFILYLLREIA